MSEPLICDTLRMAALTGRQPVTVRAVCRDHRGPDGYDYDTCQPLLAAHPNEVTAYTAVEAERHLGIPANRIRQWALRDQIKEIDRVGPSPRYLESDLLRRRSREDRKAQLDL